MHRSICYIIIFLCIPLCATAQKERCGTLHQTHEHTISQNLRTETRTNKQIQLVFHILFKTEEENISDQDIQEQIDRINLDFSAKNDDLSLVPELFQDIIGNANLSFVLASETPDGLPFSGIFRQQTELDNIANQFSIDSKQVIKYKVLGGSDAYYPESYINIWVGRSDEVFGVTAPLELAGSSDDGIIITPDAFGIIEDSQSGTNLGRTLTHELGHYFGLNHLWGSIQTCGNDDDGIKDTPEQEAPYNDCPEFPQVTCGSADMFMNFMDFTNDECLLFFTKEQVGVMRLTLEEVRSGIIVSTTDLPNKPEDLPITISQSDLGITITNQVPNYSETQIAVYSTGGQLIHKDLLNELFVHVIDTNDWPRGVYILAIYAVDQRFTHTFVAGY